MRFRGILLQIEAGFLQRHLEFWRWYGHPVGQTSARDAVEYARWDARDKGGNIDVFDKQGQLYREICIKVDALADSAFVLPSA